MKNKSNLIITVFVIVFVMILADIFFKILLIDPVLVSFFPALAFSFIYTEYKGFFTMIIFAAIYLSLYFHKKLYTNRFI